MSGKPFSQNRSALCSSRSRSPKNTSRSFSGFFQLDHKKAPVLIPIESAAAIAEAERAFESFDVPKGTLRGSPPVPEDDLTTLRTSLYLVAHKKLGTDLVTRLTQAIMSVRRNLLREQPIFAQITAPSTDQDAYLPLHPGAAAVYNSTTQSFMDEYGNWIYLTPMILGGIATVLAAAWKFLGIAPFANDGPLDTLYALGRRIRKADTEAELGTTEDEIDEILKAQRAKAAAGDEGCGGRYDLERRGASPGELDSRSPADTRERTSSRSHQLDLPFAGYIAGMRFCRNLPRSASSSRQGIKPDQGRWRAH